MRHALLVALLAGCSFNTSGLDEDDGGVPDPPDAADGDASAVDASETDAPGQPDAFSPDAGPPDITDDVAHVPEDGEFGGLADLSLGDVLIDTDSLEIDGAPPPNGVFFDTWSQEPGGPELAVLHVDNLTIEHEALTIVLGARPLVVIASGQITIDGTLDAGGFGASPGAGGAGPGAGMGAGSAGAHANTFQDSGGGGAGHGTDGARGGDAICDEPACSDADGGAPGAEYGDATQTVLRGGSGGGAAFDLVGCDQPPAGGGGGAIQLYAAVSITVSVDGAVNAGGGGGGEGVDCDGVRSAGQGGGSGGAIILQSPDINHAGVLAANGGGGGGGAGEDGDGTPGTSGWINDVPPPGGPAGGAFSTAGGAGGALATAPEPGENDISDIGNAGGGGGAVGRIQFLVSGGGLDDGGLESPAAVVTPF